MAREDGLDALRPDLGRLHVSIDGVIFSVALVAAVDASQDGVQRVLEAVCVLSRSNGQVLDTSLVASVADGRSEERRVGKECLE